MERFARRFRKIALLMACVAALGCVQRWLDKKRPARTSGESAAAAAPLADMRRLREQARAAQAHMARLHALTPEEREITRAVLSANQVGTVNPIIKTLSRLSLDKAPQEEPWELAKRQERVQAAWLRARRAAVYSLWSLAAAVFLLGLSGLFLDKPGWLAMGRVLSLEIAHYWMLGFSLSGAFVYAMTRQNLWTSLPAGFYLAPACMLGLSCALWALDREAPPLLDGILLALAAPVLGLAFIAVLGLCPA